MPTQTLTPRPASAAEYWFAAQRCDLLGLEQLARLGQVVIAISNLVHALQSERGLSNLLLGSTTQSFRDALHNQRQVVDTEQRVFFKALQLIKSEQLCQQGGSRLFRRLAYAIRNLDSLPDVRAQVGTLSVQPGIAIQAYSELIQSLLAVVFETCDTAADEQVARVLVAMYNLMQGKELAGQERAHGAASFAAGAFDTPTRQRLQHLIKRQEVCFRVFVDYADESLLETWLCKVEQGPFLRDLEYLRRKVLTRQTDDLFSEKDIALRWFDCCSARMDAIKAVEDNLEIQLLSLCQSRILVAKEALQCQDARQNHPPANDGISAVPGYAVYVSEHELAQVSSNHPSPTTELLAGRPGRTLMDLLNAQARRLKSMDEELNAVRTELHERKVIDRAKRELMKHRGLSEPEAHQCLRQLAMNQSRRLIDIAESVIAMTELLQPQ